MELAKRWRVLVATVICVVVLGFFAPVFLQGHVFYGGDIARLYLPAQAALRRALQDGRLPWWCAELGMGYPLVAEGQVAALYPLTLAMSSWLAPEVAVTAQVLLHYGLMLVGAYLFGRRLRLGVGAASFSALIWALGGFNLAHLGHVSILRAASWLPWMLWLTARLDLGLAPHKALLRSGSLALAVAMQGLAGHPQMALLNGVAVAAYALWLAAREPSLGRAARWLGLWLGAGALGLALAAPQLLPTLELVLQSQRAGGLDATFFTSYSYHPLLTATWVHPFLLGNPYPDGSVELMFYVGLAPLALAAAGVARARQRERRLFVALGLVGWLMAWGRWNPIYPWLRAVPVLNLFRVPARYLSWSGLALAYLAGMGAEALAKPRGTHGRMGVDRSGLIASVALAAAVAVWTVSWRDLDQALAAWRWLPLLLAATMVAAMLARRSLAGKSWLLLVTLVAMVDLYAYQRVLLWTYSEVAPRAAVAEAPDALDAIPALEGRVYVKEEILPARSVQRESFYPNLGLTHGVPVLNVYLPLVPTAYDTWLQELGPRELNLAAGTAYVIPQLLPVDAASELYDVQNSLAALPYSQWIDVEPMLVEGIEVVSYLSHAAALPDGTLAARLWVRDELGEELALPLRAGWETAEWAYDRDDVLEQVAHRRAPIDSSFPARSGFPPREHFGHVYRAVWRLPEGFWVSGVRIEPELSEAYVRIEEVRLVSPGGEVTFLSHLAGLGDHRIVYRSEDAVIYRNWDAFPRAWWASAEQVCATPDGLALMAGITARDVVPAAIDVDRGEEITVSVASPAEGYLVLADLYYSGWRAYVGTREAPVLCLEGVLRAVSVPAGEHEITFRYEPLKGVVARLLAVSQGRKARAP